MILARALHQPADHDPLRMAQARAPRPAAVETIAAGRRRYLPGRRRRGGDAGGVVAAPHVVLRLFREQRQHAGMVGKIIQAPRRRAAGGFAKLDGDIERHFVVVLVTAPALRLQRMNEPGFDEFVDRFLRDIAVALGAHCTFAQFRRQRASPRHEFFGARNIVRRGCRPQFSDAHGVSSRFGKDCAGTSSEIKCRATTLHSEQTIHPAFFRSDLRRWMSFTSVKEICGLCLPVYSRSKALRAKKTRSPSKSSAMEDR